MCLPDRVCRLLVSTFAILVLAMASAAGKDLTAPTAAERKLMKAVRTGKTADYSGLPDNQKTISAEFLKHLMFGTPETRVPGKLIHIKGATLTFFNFKVSGNDKPSGSAPFEIVFDSCDFSSFVCDGCRFRRGLRFAYSTFGVPGPGTGQLVLDGTEVNGNLEITIKNTLNVSLQNARIIGVVDLSLQSNSTLDTMHLKTQALNIEAFSPVTVSSPVRSPGQRLTSRLWPQGPLERRR
jgi:hypothetical protein